MQCGVDRSVEKIQLSLLVGTPQLRIANSVPTFGESSANVVQPFSRPRSVAGLLPRWSTPAIWLPPAFAGLDQGVAPGVVDALRLMSETTSIDRSMDMGHRPLGWKAQCKLRCRSAGSGWAAPQVSEEEIPLQSSDQQLTPAPFRK